MYAYRRETSDKQLLFLVKKCFTRGKWDPELHTFTIYESVLRLSESKIWPVDLRVRQNLEKVTYVIPFVLNNSIKSKKNTTAVG